MVDINIKSGQGITQAIRDKIGDGNIKNKDAATWQKVVGEIHDAQKSIFKSGDNYKTDVSKLKDNKTYHSNFVVDEGTVTIDDSVWGKIKELLSGKSEQTPNASTKNLSETVKDIKTNQSSFAQPEVLSNDVKPDVKHLDIATGKQLTRSVNGEMQKIEIQHDKDGNKVRYAVNGDGTRGEQLVTVSTAGKNKYVTQSEFDKDVRTMLQLGENDEIPKDLKPEYVTIGGSSNIVFKKDGHVMNSSQVKEFMNNYKQELAGSGEYEGKPIKEILQNIVKNMDYSGASENFINAQPDGMKLNFGGKSYTVQQGENGSKVLVDDSGKKFNVKGDKLVPCETPKEPNETYGKKGDLGVTNRSSGGYEPFIKRGQFDEE